VRVGPGPRAEFFHSPGIGAASFGDKAVRHAEQTEQFRVASLEVRRVCRPRSLGITCCVYGLFPRTGLRVVHHEREELAVNARTSSGL